MMLQLGNRALFSFSTYSLAGLGQGPAPHKVVHLEPDEGGLEDAHANVACLSELVAHGHLAGLVVVGLEDAAADDEADAREEEDAGDGEANLELLVIGEIALLTEGIIRFDS
jgi:hypothetical protein